MTEEPKTSAEAIEEAWRRIYPAQPHPLGRVYINPAVLELAKMIEKYETPPRPEVDPLVLEAREILARHDERSLKNRSARHRRAGDYDGDAVSSLAMDCISRGIELGREQRKCPELTWQEVKAVGDDTRTRTEEPPASTPSSARNGRISDAC